MGGTAERFGLMLLISATVATLARRLKLPYTVGLVLAGTAVGLMPVAQDWDLTRGLLFSALLPPLVFEAALNIKWAKFRASLTPILTLATLGLLVSAAVVTFGMMAGAQWPLGIAAVFGLLISATDPVSVVAMMKESNIGGRMRLLLESESLLNDGTAAVGFAVATSVAMGAAVTPVGVTMEFARMAGGGMLCGALVAALCIFLARNTEDNLVETAFSVVCAYGSFIFAESLHTSGILAAVVAGLIYGNLGHLGFTDGKSEESIYSFWAFAAFLANSFVFLLMGVRLAHTRVDGPLIPILVAVPIVLLGRAVSVYGVSLAFWRSKHRIEPGRQHVLVWGGLRGALSLALALGLPDEFPHVEQVRYTTFWVVVFSVLVQGITIGPLIRRVAAQEDGAKGL